MSETARQMRSQHVGILSLDDVLEAIASEHGEIARAIATERTEESRARR